MHRKHFKMKSETVKKPFYEQKTNYDVFVDGCLVSANLALILRENRRKSPIVHILLGSRREWQNQAIRFYCRVFYLLHRLYFTVAFICNF